MKLKKGLLEILVRLIKQKSLSEALVWQLFNVNKGHKADIKSMKAYLPTALAGAPWFVSRKSFSSLEIDRLVTLTLLETFVFFELIPCQSTYCHDFTSGTLLHNYWCQAYTIDSAYIRAIISTSTYCFTSRKESWYPPEHSIYNFRELKLFLPKWSESIKISVDDLERLWTWTNNFPRAVPQRLFRQEIKMTKTGRFFHAIFILIN